MTPPHEKLPRVSWRQAAEAARHAPRSASAFFLDPSRRATIGLAVGACALALALTVGGWRALAVSYLPAWLCLLALPVGALPVVIMFERADAWRPQPETALLATMRGQLALMPVAALLFAPMLLALAEIYPWARGVTATSDFSAIWFSPAFLVARLVVAFAAWTALALLFSRRGGEPWGKAGRIDDGRAVLGLGVHALLGTMVAGDLVVSVSDSFRPSLSGLLLMASWSSLALSLAIVAAKPDVGPSRRRLDRLTPLAVLLVIWACLHFVQFLMTAAANNAAAAAWYMARDTGEGRALSLFAGAVVLLSAALLLKPGENRTRLVAALAVAAHLLELSWFVTPSIRGSFKVTLVDLLTLVGVSGLAFALLPRARGLFQRGSTGRAREENPAEPGA